MDVYDSPRTIEILRTYELNDTKLIFLFAVCSHVFQLLGMGVFAMLKSIYRIQMVNLAQRDDATQTKNKHTNYYLITYSNAYSLHMFFFGRKAGGLLL